MQGEEATGGEATIHATGGRFSFNIPYTKDMMESKLELRALEKKKKKN